MRKLGHGDMEWGHGDTGTHRAVPATRTRCHSQLSGKKLLVGTSSSSSNSCSASCASSTAMGTAGDILTRGDPRSWNPRAWDVPMCHPHGDPPSECPHINTDHQWPPLPARGTLLTLTPCQPPALSPPPQVLCHLTALQEGVSAAPRRRHPLSPLLARGTDGQRRRSVPAAAPHHRVIAPRPRCGDTGTRVEVAPRGHMGSGQGMGDKA